MGKLKFTTFLSIISMLGFASIIVKTAIDYDIGVWVDASIFLLIGLALTISGGIRFFFEYFKNGLTSDEITKIATVIIGVLSVVVGLSMLPVIGWSVQIFDGVKIIIASIAIVVIFMEELLELIKNG